MDPTHLEYQQLYLNWRAQVDNLGDQADLQLAILTDDERAKLDALTDPDDRQDLLNNAWLHATPEQVKLHATLQENLGDLVEANPEPLPPGNVQVLHITGLEEGSVKDAILARIQEEHGISPETWVTPEAAEQALAQHDLHLGRLTMEEQSVFLVGDIPPHIAADPQKSAEFYATMRLRVEAHMEAGERAVAWDEFDAVLDDLGHVKADLAERIRLALRETGAVPAELQTELATIQAGQLQSGVNPAQLTQLPPDWVQTLTETATTYGVPDVRPHYTYTHTQLWERDTRTLAEEVETETAPNIPTEKNVYEHLQRMSVVEKEGFLAQALPYDVEEQPTVIAAREQLAAEQAALLQEQADRQLIADVNAGLVARPNDFDVLVAQYAPTATEQAQLDWYENTWLPSNAKHSGRTPAMRISNPHPMKPCTSSIRTTWTPRPCAS